MSKETPSSAHQENWLKKKGVVVGLRNSLIYLTGNYCYRIGAIAPPGGLGDVGVLVFVTYFLNSSHNNKFRDW